MGGCGFTLKGHLKLKMSGFYGVETLERVLTVQNNSVHSTRYEKIQKISFRVLQSCVFFTYKLSAVPTLHHTLLPIDPKSSPAPPTTSP